MESRQAINYYIAPPGHGGLTRPVTGWKMRNRLYGLGKFQSRGTLVGQDKVNNHGQLQSGVDGVCGEGGDHFMSGSRLGSPPERRGKNGYKKEVQHPSFSFLFFFLFHLHSSQLPSSSQLLYPARKKKNKNHIYSATPVPSRLTVLLSESEIQPRHTSPHCASSQAKPLSHTLPCDFTFLPPQPPHSSQIFFNPSIIQICLQHKPSMHPPIPPSLLPCQENHLTTPPLWHTKSHMPAPSSHRQRQDPASTPRPCHL